VDTDGNVSPMSAIISVGTLSLPSAPAKLTATAVSTVKVGLTWTAGPSGMPLTGYYVFQGTKPSNLTQVATTGATSYTNGSLSPGVTYYYAVEEFDKTGNVSPMSAIVSATTLALPSPPKEVVATVVSTAEISLSWTTGPSGLPIGAYYIFRGTKASNLIQLTTIPTTAFNDYQVTPATTYYYAVEEVDQNGNVSPMSAVVSATTPGLPTAPKQLGATAISTTAIGLTWTAGSSGMPLTGYYVFEGTKPSNLTQVATTGATSYTAGSLTPGTTYYFAVEEFDKVGNVSSMSAVVSATTLALPSPPASVTATATSKVEINLTWTAAHSGMPLASYRVFQGSSPSNLSQLIIVGSTTTSMNVYPVTPGTTYYYGIESTDTLGNISPMSVVAQVTTPN
jgi:fibronectin type 3 domain-containing protein